MTQPPKYAQQYFVKDNCLFESGNNKQGAYTKKLCNFTPEAVREIMKDDGISFERYVQLGGIHQSGRQLPEITIPAEDVEGLGWIVKYWGMDCILEPGLKTKASVWNAIQSTALDMERITAFATTGWRHVDGNWRYLLPGDEQYTVELPGKMHGYGMERSYNLVDIQTAASLLWQPLASEEIMHPLLSFTFLSPLNHFLKAAGCEPKFVMLLSGKTGSRKSTLAALMLSFFGKFTASELPLSFRDTANSILLNTFSLKDVLTVIDDLHPSSRMEEPKMNGTAQAIMRAYGDRTGKGRLRADSTPMESRPPQGNAIITAEFAPDIGESGTARYFALELKEKDVDLETLSVYQKEADDGTLQRCMFAYTEWIRESFLFSEESVQKFQKYLRTRFLFYRDRFREGGIQCHGRVPETVAQLEIGMEFFLRFLLERGGFADDWCHGVFERFRSILTRLARNQSDSIDEDKPTHVFIRKLYALLDSGKGSVAGAVFGLFRGDETEFTEDTAILIAESGEDGGFTFENVPFGNWQIVELKPAEGFLPNGDPYPVQVDEDGQIIEITAVNDRVPEIGTTATVGGEKDLGATEVFTLEDVVVYRHLIPGKEYALEGVLMDKATGEPLRVNGEEIRSEVTFIPEAASGSVVVTFTFDSKYIKADTDIVVFESLYKDGLALAVHADIEDEGQTVTLHVPEIGTQATAEGKKEVEAKGEITIEDVVSYKNLTPGKEYTLSGILMNKTTGKPFTVDGKEIRSEATFTPEAAEGEVRVQFIFDAKGLTTATEVVVFESLRREGVQIAVHADIGDKGQTVKLTPPVPDAPKTGDESNPGFWIGLCAISLGGMVPLVIVYFKKKRDGRDGNE